MTTLLALHGGAAVLALLVAIWTHGRRSTAEVCLAALAAYLIAVHSAVLASGVAGHLTPVAVGLLLALGAAACAAGMVARRSPGDASSPSPAAPAAPAPGSDRVVSATAPGLFAWLAAAVAGAAWMWPHLVGPTRLWIWDDYTYHMVYPALWLREHAITAPAPARSFTMQAWYPLSASVVASWFMLPFPGSRGDALAWVSLTGPLYAALFAAGSAALLSRLGCRAGAWAVAAVLFATSTRIGIMASSFSDADLAQATALFAACAFALPRREVETRRDATIDAGYAGALSGLALGIKVSAAVPALVIAGVAAARAASTPASGARRGRADRLLAGLAIAAVFGLAWLGTGGYWYVRNLIAAGNPLYPAAFLGWPGAVFPETSLAEYARRYGLARTIADAATVYFNWPVLHGALAVVGLVGLALRLVRRRSRLARPERFFAIGALAIAAAVLSSLPATPYSAGNAMTFRSGFVHWDSMRYVALLPMLGWTALSLLIDRARPALRGAGVAAVISAAFLASTDPWLRSPSMLLAIAALATAVSAVVALARRRSGTSLPSVPLGTQTADVAIGSDALRVNRRAVVIAAVAACLTMALIAWEHGAKAAATAAAIYREPLFGGAAAALDRAPPQTRVATFGDQWIYPTFGARDHLEPIRLDGDGRVATASIGDAMAPGEPAVDAATLLANLRRSGVRLVVVSHLPHPGRSPDRPGQEAALTRLGARSLWAGNGVAVWSLDPEIGGR